MKKEKYPHFTDLSDRECETPGCRNRIKRKLILLEEKANKNKVRFCYRCHMLMKKSKNPRKG